MAIEADNDRASYLAQKALVSNNYTVIKDIKNSGLNYNLTFGFFL
jgi:hypothetical protein